MTDHYICLWEVSLIIKFNTLVDLLLIVCICDDKLMVLSISTLRYVCSFFISRFWSIKVYKCCIGSMNGYNVE